VAANFTAAIKKLAPLFEKKTGHKLLASFGATGQLYAQINNGAPFDVFLSADETTPQKLIAEGNAVPASYFIYARGRLALWSSQPGYVDDQGAILKSDKFTKIAIANPKAAPYGQAAIDALTALKLLDQLQPKFVMGENIAQTQQFVSSGNVPLGFIALAQVKSLAPEDRGSWWVVPTTLHKPIDQGAVQLSKSASAQAATAFLVFLKSPEAIAIIRELGYEIP
jgi:molybdate transport system substrate-binding protein